MNQKCRRCDHDIESLSHILGTCPFTKGIRIRRHDLVVDLVEKAASGKGARILREQTFNLEGTNLVPDLVVLKENKGWVVDPAVVSEDRIGVTRRIKVEKYSPLIAQLSAMYPGREWSVHGLPISYRGILPPCTIRALQDMGIYSGKLGRDIVMSVVKGSVRVTSCFDDGYSTSFERRGVG